MRRGSGARLVGAAEPRAGGSYARGRRLLRGVYRFDGEEIEAPELGVWEVSLGLAAEAERLAFGWLDDLAAFGDARARECARRWVMDWIRDQGGRPRDWRPETTGRRLIRWVGQSDFVLRGAGAAEAAAYAESLDRQARHLARRWKDAPAGLPRIAALTGLIHAGHALAGRDRLARAGAAALAAEAAAAVDGGGGIASRNPEEALDILTLLNWAGAAIRAAGAAPPPALDQARARLAPVLRALRHADGGLARFHGGGRGAEGALDSALAEAGTRGRAEGLAMGYARLAAARTTVIMDAALPPRGAASARAHAATLAFEMTSGRRPVVVNCGAGLQLGPDWIRAGRATPSQSTLGVDGYSSSRLGPGRDGAEWLTETPDAVPVELGQTVASQRAAAAHNGWQRTHGLTHARTLDLTTDGRVLTGEELLVALTDRDKALFDAMLREVPAGPAWSLRFHLHPGAEVALDMGGTAVSITLKSGEVWIFRQEGAEALALRPSVWLENGGDLPRETTQVVLSGRAMAYATRVRWSLAKAQDTPIALRDLGPDPDAEDGADD